MNLFGVLLMIAIIIPAVLLLITAVSRLNDIGRDRTSKRWWVRRLGLFLVTVSMGGVIGSYFAKDAPYWMAITVLTGLWGFALTWLTTPGMPPWHKYISRYDPKLPAGENDVDTSSV